ncbi:MAG TPA: hypothetical protein VH684_07060 [Xanthobacteraceae bacterium]
MFKLANSAGLDGLLNLDRQGVDIRPTLLRVITDQYLQTAVHTQDEERQFTELTLRLIDETDVTTRAAVAQRLAPHPWAPHAIILRLARDAAIEVAEPILLHSPSLAQTELDAIAAQFGRAYAEIISRRRRAIEPGKNAPAETGIEAAPANEQRNDAIDLSTSEGTGIEAPGDPEARELCDMFFAADSDERKLILTMLDSNAAVPAELPCEISRNDIWRLESAALQHNTDTVIQELQRALGVSRQLARRIVHDDLGEGVVAAAKALAVPTDVLQRILLFMNPRVGQSVERVHNLAGLCGEITPDAARRLLRIWQDAEPAQSQSPARKAHWQETVLRARQALSEISIRRSGRSEPPPSAAPSRASGGSAA